LDRRFLGIENDGTCCRIARRHHTRYRIVIIAIGCCLDRISAGCQRK
jgi:hypothetical protein